MRNVTKEFCNTNRSPQAEQTQDLVVNSLKEIAKYMHSRAMGNFSNFLPVLISKLLYTSTDAMLFWLKFIRNRFRVADESRQNAATATCARKSDAWHSRHHPCANTAWLNVTPTAEVTRQDSRSSELSNQTCDPVWFLSLNKFGR